MRKIILCGIFLPFMTHASLDKDINTLLDWFYKPEIPDKELSYEADLDISNTQIEADLSRVPIPENPSMQDIIDFQQKIMQQESLLESIEREIEASAQSALMNQHRAGSTLEEINLLETQSETFDLGKRRADTEITRLKQDLVRLAKEKTKLRIIYIEAEKDYRDFIIKQQVRRNFFRTGNGFSFIQWLLSDKSSSDIIKEEQHERTKSERKEQLLKNLWILKTQMDFKEKEAAFLYARVTRMNQELNRRAEHLEGMQADREKLYDAYAGKNQAETQQVSQLRYQQGQTAQLIQDLRAALDQTKIKLALSNPKGLEINYTAEYPFIYPSLSRSISADFHDEAYEAELGRTHEGVDFELEQGSQVIVVADGVVEKVEDGGYGYSFITVKHEIGTDEQVVYSLYGHLSQMTVSTGVQLFQGQEIGRSGGEPGTPGAGYWTTGPHLHFAVFTERGFVNPLKFINTNLAGN